MSPRFDVWANVYGTWASLQHPEDPLDASWERNKRRILLAEELGFDSTLIAQHEVGGHKGATGKGGLQSSPLA
jgi:alkanesulfonate monooxygenase